MIIEEVFDKNKNFKLLCYYVNRQELFWTNLNEDKTSFY